MHNTLEITKLIKNNDEIIVNYQYNGKWKEFLNGNTFFARYDTKINDVPNCVAIVPFLSNVLPIMWIFDLKIKISELDSDFYKAVLDIKKGYEQMYPTIQLKGQLIVDKTIKNEDNLRKKSVVLFSGGVDAYCTLLDNFNKNPDIITIFGADIKLSDKSGIEKVNKLNNSIANELNINYHSIFSNFREVINENKLTDAVKKFGNYEWWHDFQHGIALISLVSPIASFYSYKEVYIASSFTEEQKGKYSCASDPLIDNNFKCNNTITIHDGYELNRQQKIANITNKKKEMNIKEIKLRVCWISNGGENCCECEKCYRTIMGIIAEKENPNKYFFDMTKSKRKKMNRYLKVYLKYNSNNSQINRYKPIQKRFIENYLYEEMPKDLKWFADIKIGEKNNLFFFKIFEHINYITKRLKKILKKLSK